MVRANPSVSTYSQSATISGRIAKFAVLVSISGFVLSGCGPEAGADGDTWSLGSDAGPRVPDTDVDGERIISELDDSEVRGVCESLAVHLNPLENFNATCLWLGHFSSAEDWSRAENTEERSISDARDQCREARKSCEGFVEERIDRQSEATVPAFLCRRAGTISDSCDATVGQWKRCVVELDAAQLQYLERLPACSEATRDLYANPGDRLECPMPPECQSFHDACPDFAFSRAFRFLGGPPFTSCLGLGAGS